MWWSADAELRSVSKLPPAVPPPATPTELQKGLTPAPAGLALTTLKGVGPRLAERLVRLGIHDVQGLLLHLPMRYQDRSRVRAMDALVAGSDAVVEGTVVDNRITQGRKRMLLAVISDGSGQLTLRFFNHSKLLRSQLALDRRLRVFGEVRHGFESGLEMVHPEVEPADDRVPTQADGEGHLTPVYPTTEGLHQSALRRLIEQALALLEADAGEGGFLPELLADVVSAAPAGGAPLPTLAQAIRQIHHPRVDDPLPDPEPALGQALHPALQRLALEELLAHHLSLRQLRGRWRQRTAPVVMPGRELAARLLQGLPFSLTGAQRRVIAEVMVDLASGHPMQRLVQGDVGSGKTLVAAGVICEVVEAGYQAAVMAPTELLAEQHRVNFEGWLRPLGVEVAWLSGRSQGAVREQTLEQLRSGRARVVVGTHALFQQAVEFCDLALVVVDEQHRFGVHQRLALREKGAGEQGWPHQLVMTATPIPRTLAMTAYADLSLSVIDELPPGRTPVTTAAVPETRREEVIERIRAVCADHGRQAYWVCTLIDESETLQAQAAEDTAQLLVAVLPGLRVGLVHGRMKAADKQAVMSAFKQGETDLLVATTVIEVGVDVPNASLMIIENAERLGLAQLHQLRGRVGRGATASACLLMYHPPLSDNARARLGVLRESNDGFEVARRDLELRGPGEILGTRQTGQLQFRVADLLRDTALIEAVDGVGRVLLERHPERVGALVQRWLPTADRYGEV